MEAHIVETGLLEVMTAVQTKHTRLLLDGVSYPPMLDPAATMPPLFGCFGYDWTVFSQPRQDSLALLEGPLSNTPTLIGNETERMLSAFAKYAGRPCPNVQLGFRVGQPIQLGHIQITPIAGRRFSGDGCAFLLRGDGQTFQQSVRQGESSHGIHCFNSKNMAEAVRMAKILGAKTIFVHPSMLAFIDRSSIKKNSQY